MSTKRRDNRSGTGGPERRLRHLVALGAVALLWTGGQAAEAPAGKSPVVPRVIVTGYGREQPFRVPAGIWFDTNRREIYVADRGNHKVSVFDENGLPLRSFIHFLSRTDTKGKVVPTPGEPRGVAVNSRGDIYILDDLDSAIDVVDYRGRSLQHLLPADLVASEDPPLGPTDAVTPTAVAVDTKDRVYLALSGSRCEVVVLDRDGQVLRRFGHRGKERGSFIAITGLWVDREGQVLVTDAQATPVQVFSPEGEVLLGFGEHALGPQNFSLPNGAVRDANGDIWVADAIRQVTRRFSSEGELLDIVGGTGNRPGQMYYPTALAGDGDRLLIVLEKDGARFQIFQVVS